MEYIKYFYHIYSFFGAFSGDCFIKFLIELSVVSTMSLYFMEMYVPHKQSCSHFNFCNLGYCAGSVYWLKEIACIFTFSGIFKVAKFIFLQALYYIVINIKYVKYYF